jgi:hypothetical protein
MNQVIIALLLLAVATLLVLWLTERGRAGRASRARNQVAQAGEAAAVALLEDAGYTVTDAQVTRTFAIEVDGDEIEVWCRCDYLVEDDDGVYVAEVKTGDEAPDPTRPATRRQLLEYERVFEVDGVLLVDVPGGRVLRVRFPPIDG